MQKRVDLDSPELIAAIRIWSGWGRNSWPDRNDSRLRTELGSAGAERFLATIKQLQADFYSSEAYLNASDLAKVGQLAMAEFRRLHPNVADEVVEILAWCYTFDWK